MRWEKGICWFRRDLRVFDNRALSEATRHCKSVYTVFIFDTCIIGGLKKNDRRMSFIWASVEELKQKIKDKGGRLITLYGDPKILVPRLARSLRVDAVFAGEDYEPKSIERDEAVRRKLESEQQRLILLKDHVVHTPVEVLKDDGSAYRVFTPYSKVWKKRVSIDLVSIARLGQGVLKKTKLPSDDFKSPRSLASIGFEEQKLKFDPGESSGRKTFNKFKSKIDSYHKLRDFPAEDGGSHLSVYLRFGNISIRELVRFCLKENSAGISVWLNELIWREFYMMILFQFPHVVGNSFLPKYQHIVWPGSDENFELWKVGETGFPIVDAAMRDFKNTGWMHNRLRMIVASFLVKDLLVDWRYGEKYFAENLLDFELASNNGGWQWCASTGCDAQPYFRIFNPHTQSKRFDPQGVYIKRHVPELASMKSPGIHFGISDDSPKLFDFDSSAMSKQGKAGGKNGMTKYCSPLVDHKVQREKALMLFKAEATSG